MTEPVFQHGSFRLYLLQALADGPRHGYDVIASIGERFGGSYRPSPGTVYPRLGQLLREGLVSVTRDGRKRVYALTEAGRAELARHSDELDALNAEVDDSVQRLAMDVRARVAESLKSMRADLAAAAQHPPAASHESDAASQATQQALRAEVTLLVTQFSSSTQAKAATLAAKGELTPELVASWREAMGAITLEQ